MLNKLIAGSDTRKTRLHDERGRMISIGRLIRNGPRALGTGFMRLAFGRRGGRPWISYDAQARIARHLDANSRVLEFGSGTSTIWYARRAGEVLAIEDYKPWYDRVKASLERHSASNVRYRFASNVEDYTNLDHAERGDGFDLIIVDGTARDLCVHRSLDLLRPGGIIYLDNSDRTANTLNGDMPAARKALEDYAVRVGGGIESYTDFAPTQLFVQEGLLVQRPA